MDTVLIASPARSMRAAARFTFFSTPLTPKPTPNPSRLPGAGGMDRLFIEQIGLQGLWNVREQLLKVELFGLL